MGGASQKSETKMPWASSKQTLQPFLLLCCCSIYCCCTECNFACALHSKAFADFSPKILVGEMGSKVLMYAK